MVVNSAQSWKRKRQVFLMGGPEKSSSLKGSLLSYKGDN
jgi:hypothetical protein